LVFRRHGNRRAFLIPHEAVEGFNAFAETFGLVAAPVASDRLVASQLRGLWTT
jgi:hypothetical protein